MKLQMSREVDLGKEPVGRLLVILALPAITSQVINALYNMVDRMYIGHIEGIGADALTGVGVCFPIIMIVSAFAYLLGMGGAPRASICMGKKQNQAAEKILGNCFLALVLVAFVLTAIRRQRSDDRLCERIYQNLCDRHAVCTADAGHERLYLGTGIFHRQHAHRRHRCDHQHHPRSDLHLSLSHECQRRRLGDDSLTGDQRRVGGTLSDGKQDRSAFETREYAL